MRIRARAPIICIPLIVADYKSGINAIHNRMTSIFYNDFSIGFFRNIVLESYATKKIAEPLPHPVAIKLTQQRSVMKANPTDRPFVNTLLELFCRYITPRIWRIVQLDNQVRLRNRIGPQ